MDAAVLDRPSDLDVVKGLEARGAELVGVLNAAVAGLVSVIADALVCEAWQGHGINSPEHWVALRFGMNRRRATRLVAAARALGALPTCRAAFAAGEIGEDHVAAIVNAQVQPRNDAEAAGLARHATVGQFRHGLRGLPRPDDDDDDAPAGKPDPAKKPSARPAREYVSRGRRDDGGWHLNASLSAADGALVDKALEAATDKLLRARHGDDVDPSLRQRISAVDALRHVALLALDAMDPATAAHPDRVPSERYLVNIHIDAADPDRAHIHLGPALPARARDEMWCDALVRTWVRDQHGNVNLGRTQRTVGRKLRTVVEHRDCGCVIPGCDAVRGLRVHHLVPWSEGGATDTTNLVLICGDHHRRLHAGELTIGGNADIGLTFADDRGRPITATPPVTIGPARTPTEAALDLGLPTPGWTNRTGEHAQWDCMVWTEPPDRGP